jgi:hypothetical protein
MTTTLTIDDPEMALLRSLVHWRLSGLNIEIEHTDSRDFKDMLKNQRDALERLERKLLGTSG